MAADGRRAFIENTLTHSATRRHRPSYTLHHHHQQQQHATLHAHYTDANIKFQISYIKQTTKQNRR